jgi:GTP cyclohydrolase I
MTELHELEKAYAKIIDSTGDELSREGLVKTPHRAAKAFRYLTHGYTLNLHDIVNGALFESVISEMIIIKDIELYSLCEHHLLPFIGKCHIGYIPKNKILGLSKFARIVDLYSRRLQIQENLSQNIADGIQEVTDCEGIGVIIEAQHMCMMMRGVEKQNSIMKTSCLKGSFLSSASTRSEFFQMIR